VVVPWGEARKGIKVPGVAMTDAEAEGCAEGAAKPGVRTLDSSLLRGRIHYKSMIPTISFVDKTCQSGVLPKKSWRPPIPLSPQGFPV